MTVSKSSKRSCELIEWLCIAAELGEQRGEKQPDAAGRPQLPPAARHQISLSAACHDRMARRLN
jgi:hypothetical protein